jgi:hypothetical protein
MLFNMRQSIYKPSVDKIVSAFDDLPEDHAILDYTFIDGDWIFRVRINDDKADSGSIHLYWAAKQGR